MLLVWEWLKKQLKVYFNEELDVEQQLFNLIVALTGIGGAISCLVSLSVGVPSVQVVVASIGIVIILYGLYVANYKKKFKIATVSITFLVAVIIFPAMYLTAGGKNGGMPLWMILGIVFTFSVCKGISFWILTILEIVVYTLTIYISYKFPEILIPFDSVRDEYIDVWQSLIFVSCVVGIMFRFQSKNYRAILKRNVEQRNNMEMLKEEAEKASKTKSDFLANMSHEIRTPMNAIIGMARIALNSDEELPESVSNNLQDILSSGNTLLSIINDILDFSKIESGKLEIVPATFHLSSLIHDVVTVVKIRVEEKGLKLNVAVDPSIPNVLFGDEIRIKQILTNILNNAVKFTESGSITLRATWNRDADMANLIFQIEDTGQGIREENLENLFERFSRLELNKNRSIEGTGLGLTISKQLAEMMNGSINVKSVFGEGSTFIIQIKLRILDDVQVYGQGKVYKNLIKEKGNNKLSFPGAKVLVVDDNMMNLRVAKGLMDKYKMNIKTLESGEACIAACKEETFDLIFLDHMMPNMDGVETLEHIRKDYLFHTPVVALTANAIHGVETQYLNWGFNGYLAKPIRQDALERILSKYLIKYQNEVIIEIDKGNTTRVTNITAGSDVMESSDGDQQVISNQSGVKIVEENKMAVNIPMDEKLNEADGLAYLGDSMEMYVEVLEIYVQESAENEEKMADYLAAGNLKNYASIAHAIKSNSRLIGLPVLGDYAYEFELKGKAEDMEFIKENHDTFIESIHYGRGLVEEYLKNKA